MRAAILNTKQNSASIKGIKSKRTRDSYVIFVSCIIVYLIAANNDLLEIIVAFSQQHENWELDEFISVTIYLMFALILFSVRRWKEIKRSESLLSDQNKKLLKAMEEIKQLKGIIPICASCKRIRNDAGFWEQVEKYVSTHTGAKFTHSTCPQCSDKLYGNEDWYISMKKQKGIK